MEIYKGFGEAIGQAHYSIDLAWLLHSDNQLDAAEEAAFRAIDLLPEEGEQFRVCESHRILGEIYQSKGETEKAIHHYEAAIGIASSFDWYDNLFWAHYRLAGLFRDEGRLDDAQAHVEHTRSYTADNPYYLGYSMEEQAWVWFEQCRFEEARSEALRAANVYEKFGATKRTEECRTIIQRIQEELDGSFVSGQSTLSRGCEPL